MKKLRIIDELLFDVDNTLIGNESSELPSERFRTAAKLAKAVGINIGIASARPLQKVQYILEACGMEGLCVLSNGAQIYDAKRGVVAEECSVDYGAALEILDELKSRNLHFWVNDGGVDYFWKNELGSFVVAENVWDRADKANKLVEYDPIKPYVILAHNVSSEERQALLGVADYFSQYQVEALTLHEATQASGDVLYDVAFVHQMGNKRSALQRIMELNGKTAAHYMAVGDGHNDAVIVGHVGVGVAVANAVQSVKDVAALHVPSWSDDGAAIALEQLLAAKN